MTLVSQISKQMQVQQLLRGEQAGTWAPIAATAFSASNAPEAVPLVFQYAVRGLESRDERLLLVRKMKDAVFKSGTMSGYPKAINALIHLNTVLPDDLRDAAPLRDLSLTTSDLNRIGQEHFSRTYGDTTDTVQSLLERYTRTWLLDVTSYLKFPTDASAAVAAPVSQGGRTGWHLGPHRGHRIQRQQCPEAVPLVFQYAVRGLESRDERLLLVRKMKDAVFKSGLLSGYPKAINALIHLNTILPDDLRDTTPLRWECPCHMLKSHLCPTQQSFADHNDLNRIGQEHASRTYGDTTETVQSLIKETYPDLEYFLATFSYGYTMSFSQVLSAAETSLVTVAALIATDTPRQTEWHLQGAMRNGASRAEVTAVRQISMEVSRMSYGNTTFPIYEPLP
ncbi:AhpD-like protein [Infundibulicybe gibba]|nr:AhpD-like protein [Infundibulicybe gibba]